MDNYAEKHWYVGQTVVSPLGLTILLALSLATMVLPRRLALAPLLILSCFMAPAQRVIVFGLNFNFQRILVLLGVMRAIARGEFRGLRLKLIDKAFIAWVGVSTVVYLLQVRSSDAFVYRLGASFDALGAYFLCRALVRDWRDVRQAALVLLIASLPTLAMFMVERTTRRNPFSVFGGVPPITEVREGKLRCQGPFPHAIIAGCFWALVVPFAVAESWNRSGARLLTLGSIAAALLVVLNTYSSTPIMSLLFAAVCGAVYLVRRYLRWLRWSVVSMLLGLSLAMNGPIWGIMAWIDFTGSSTGYHRAVLMTEGINRMREWWLVGTNSTEHWAYGLTDITNQYLLEGINGGIWALVLFVAMIVLAFRGAGRIIQAAEHDTPRRVFAWALGTAIFIHMMTFFGLAYFGPMMLMLFLHYAMIASLDPGAPKPTQAGSLVAKGPELTLPRAARMGSCSLN